jgi:putative endonuclease
MPDSWYVYILECADGSLYTGVTLDPKRRLAEHQAGGCRYTRSRRGVRMLRTRRCASKVRAYRYEWALKRSSRRLKLEWCRGKWQPHVIRAKKQSPRKRASSVRIVS